MEMTIEKKKLRRINDLERAKQRVTREMTREVLERLSLSPNITIPELAKEMNKSESETIWREISKPKKIRSFRTCWINKNWILANHKEKSFFHMKN